MPRHRKLVDVKAVRERKKTCAPGQEFVFRLPDGREFGKAKDIVEFIKNLKSAPLESVLYHANGNHFAPWLDAIGEKGAASRVKTVGGDSEEVRRMLISRI
jgi:hypothetical protein